MAGRARLKAAVPRPPPFSSPIGSGLFCLGSSSPGPAMALLSPALLPVAEMLRPLPLTPLVRRFGRQGADGDSPRTVGCGRPAEGRRWHGDRPQEAGQGGRKFPRLEQCRTPPRPRADRARAPSPVRSLAASLPDLAARARRPGPPFGPRPFSPLFRGWAARRQPKQCRARYILLSRSV